MKFEIAPLETEIQADWYHANLYCQFLEIDGKKDWRLPTLKEVDEVDDPDDYHLMYKFYWTATEENNLKAMVIGYDNLRPTIKQSTKKDCVVNVRVVRDI